MLRKIVTSLYFSGLFLMMGEGILAGLSLGWTTPIELIPYVKELPAYPFSLILWPLFGLLLYKRFKTYAPLMFGFSYAIWDAMIVPRGYIVYQSLSFNQVPYYTMYVVWAVLIIVPYVVVRPKFNLTHYASVLLFLYWANVAYTWYNLLPSESLSEFLWFLFIWKSLFPRSGK